MHTYQDTTLMSGHSVKVTSDAERRHLLMNGHRIEHVYRGSVIAEITATVWASLDGDRFVFKGLTGEHSLQINCTDAARLAAHWNVFTEENRKRHDASLS